MSDNNPFRHRFQERARAAEERIRARQAQVTARGHDLPEPGDLYVFGGEFPIGLQWVVLDPHPQDPEILFVIPADDAPWVGTADMPTLLGSPTAPLILRCGCGLWLRNVCVSAGVRIAHLDEQDQRRARDLLARLVRGESVPTVQQQETDADPAYEAWIHQVLEAMERLRHLAESESEGEREEVVSRRVISAEKFHRRWPTRLARTPDLAHDFALAAASFGPLGNVMRELTASPTLPPPMCPVELEGVAGELYVVAEPAGTRLVYWPHERELPPDLEVINDHDEVVSVVEWRRSPLGTVFASFPIMVWHEVGGQRMVHFRQPKGVPWSIERPERVDE